MHAPISNLWPLCMLIRKRELLEKRGDKHLLVISGSLVLGPLPAKCFQVKLTLALYATSSVGDPQTSEVLRLERRAVGT